jgi:small subunit ribosomal protein S20
MRNRKAKSEIRTVVRKFTSFVDAKNKEDAEKEFSSVKKFLDTACQRGVLHKNTVARKKARLAKKLNSLA